MEKKPKIFHVSWFGGEPLLGIKSIISLSQYFQNLSIENQASYSSSITTNGYLLTKGKFKRLVEECSVRNFQITIDGDEEHHNFQRVLKGGGGSYQRILENLISMQGSDLDYSCTLRFNITKENLESVEKFLDGDGRSFKGDSRFNLHYHNVGNWGCGERSKDYSVTILPKDLTFELSKKAIEKGYNVPSVNTVITNLFNCYANRPNHYTINVKGIIQSCTVALYDAQNIFGSVHTKLNERKFKSWKLQFDSRCTDCPVALICKSGYCPPVHNGDKRWRFCEQIKRRIDSNLDLFLMNNEYNDYLDIEERR
ncbi:uncharacterized protein ABID29_002312 [Streptococcus rupicaprae]|uniref:Radical SAM core domain-containing protein n=1 Tax=Streptococcus rupicaprae TaxID=759619 RepID=A0ABV2FKR1_9STRE